MVLVEWGDVVEGVFGDHLTVYLDQDVDEPDADADVADGDADADADGDADADDDADDDDDADVLSLDGRRLIDMSGVGTSWASRWERLARVMEAYRC